MSDGEVLVSDGQESEAGEEIMRDLPAWMPRDESTGNFKLLDVVGRAIDRLDGDIQNVDQATNVQTAESVEQLEKLAALIDLPPKEGEPLEKYRTRVIGGFQATTSEGTISDLIINTATILGVRPEEVGYSTLQEQGAVELVLPSGPVSELSLTGSELVNVIGRNSAAGFRIEATLRGDFTFLDSSDYTGPYNSSNGGYDSSELQSNSDYGHTTLDSNGDPKETGGTYAGLLE